MTRVSPFLAPPDRVGPLIRVEVLPSQVESLPLAETQPHHHPDEGAHMGIAGACIDRLEELQDPPQGDHRAGDSLDLELGDPEGKGVQIPQAHPEIQDRLEVLEGVVDVSLGKIGF